MTSPPMNRTDAPYQLQAFEVSYYSAKVRPALRYKGLWYVGLRFFTDYLAGNVYFKSKSAEHNLTRALVQFKLTESIESQERAIRTIVREAR